MSEVTITAPLRSRFGVSLPILFALLVYVNVISLPHHTLEDPDTYWHIVLGRWIIDHAAVPHRDLFSFSMPGAPFVPFEWLAEVAIAAIYDYFGWAGLAAAAALSAAATLACYSPPVAAQSGADPCAVGHRARLAPDLGPHPGAAAYF